ncbi:MAG: molybdate ABC transporter permease subunit [Phycisphaerae bacterium]
MWLTSAEGSALWLSLRVALWSTAACLLPGIAFGWLLARRQFPGKALLDALLHLPLVLPPVVVGYLLLLALGRTGPVGRWLYDTLGVQLAFTWQGAVVAAAVMGFPLMVRSVRLAVELVDPRLEQAAGTLGASPYRVFATITLPLAVPGIVTGLLLCFARSLGEFGATITFVGNIAGQTRTLPLAMFSFLQVPGGDAAAFRLMLISVLLSISALLASDFLARRAMARLGRT